jgi:hypothetical protein
MPSIGSIQAWDWIKPRFGMLLFSPALSPAPDSHGARYLDNREILSKLRSAFLLSNKALKKVQFDVLAMMEIYAELLSLSMWNVTGRILRASKLAHCLLELLCKCVPGGGGIMRRLPDVTRSLFLRLDPTWAVDEAAEVSGTDEAGGTAPSDTRRPAAPSPASRWGFTTSVS